ncbi:MAG: hypothetical protein ICV51_22340, partial [Flavisolibacter sp.]|nr:hypothetical protein [Flavisolibacter sp.]
MEIYKLFKGTSERSTIEVMTEGGSVEGVSVKASDLLSLKKNSIGLFFCFPNKVNLKSPVTKRVLQDVYSSAQGFFQYDLVTQRANAPFVQYNDIETTLYEEIKSMTGRVMQNINANFSVRSFSRQQSRMMGPVISSFSPTTVNAGALLDPSSNVLTITGNGFGTAAGVAAVLFDDPDDGTGGADYVVDYNDSHIISWTDNEIRIRVPTYAGTGFFKVRDAAGNVSSSPTPLQVLFSILTDYFYYGGIWYVKESNLMNINGSGGYTIKYSNNTAGSGIDINTHPAKATFQRALTTWKEIAGLNITEGNATAVQAAAYDGTNVVVFDNANTGHPPLAAGVLAVCYSYNNMCAGNMVEYQAQKVEFDIVIRNTGYSTGTTTFSLGPCPPNSSNFTEVDLETVLLHELGHALNLGHINDTYQGSSIGKINPGKLMHYAVVNSAKRTTPDYAAKAGADYAIAPQNNAYGFCLAPGEMIPLAITTEAKDNCPLSFPVSAVPAGTIVHFDLNHATSNRFNDPNYTQVRCDGIGTSITNNAYYAFKTNNESGLLTL